jgi:AbrB family looped-hinge helix DNA binding protein
MKCSAKITSKGQITIPIEVRRALGVGEGDSVVFETDGDGIRVAPKRTGESPFAKYRGIGNPGMPSGREAVLRHLREMHGRDPDEEQWEQAYARKAEKAARAKKSA